MPVSVVFACTVYVSGDGVGPLARIELSSCTCQCRAALGCGPEDLERRPGC